MKILLRIILIILNLVQLQTNKVSIAIKYSSNARACMINNNSKR